MSLEVQHLRNLIGNVAHDLKTPLQSITMDLDMLRAECDFENKLTRNGLHKFNSEEKKNSVSSPFSGSTAASSLLSSSTPPPLEPPVRDVAGSSLPTTGVPPATAIRPSHSPVDLSQILGSLTATCNFMTMAINRCLDFAKVVQPSELSCCVTMYLCAHILRTSCSTSLYISFF
jgi:signal transduction histidine kinase